MANPTQSENSAASRRRATRELIAFFALTFAITFGIGASVIFFRPQVEAIVGPIGAASRSWRFFVLFDIAASAPTISAVVWSFVFGGREGLKSLFRGLVRPVRLRWVLVALLTMPKPTDVLTTSWKMWTDGTMLFGLGQIGLRFGPREHIFCHSLTPNCVTMASDQKA
jgi:hypothetical protein